MTGLAREALRGRLRAVLLLTTALVALLLSLAAADARGSQSRDPQVAVDEDGNAYFTWQRYDGTDQVYTRKRNANGTLTAVQELSAKGQNAGSPQGAVDPEGNAYFTWTLFNGS